MTRNSLLWLVLPVLLAGAMSCRPPAAAGERVGAQAAERAAAKHPPPKAVGRAEERRADLPEPAININVNVEVLRQGGQGQFRNVATGHCLDSGGNTSSGKVPVYSYGNCGYPSRNLWWTYDQASRQIRNAATGYCLDSGGDTSSAKVRAWTYADCANSSDNLKWEYDLRTGHIWNVATGYCLDSGGATKMKVRVYTYRDCGNPSGNLQWDFVS
jgi:putative hemolysin